MKHDCHYHPGAPATWHCRECQAYYCSRCMPDADTRRHRALCPKCNKAMQYLGAATETTPFWNRIGAFFRYPFHSDPLIVIAICTLVPLAAPASLAGLLIWVLLALALFKYTYAVINHTAEGHLKPPPVSVAFTGSGFSIVILQFLVFIVIGGLAGAAALLGGPLLLMLTLAFAILALPASIMILAMERSVGAAVNPMKLTALISRIGSPYFLLYGYLILLTLASGMAQDFALNHFPFWLSQPLSGFLNSTFTLILFNMLGYLLFQYQEELGFTADIQDPTEEAVVHQRDRSSRFDADIDMNLKDGNYDRVQAMLNDALKKDPEDPLRIGQLYRLLAARNNATELYRYHPRILSWLADSNDGEGIASVLELLEHVEPGFRPDDPELAVRCARCLYNSGHYKPTLRLLQDFHKRFPDSEELAPAYLLVAQALANGMNQWEKATAFLTFIQKRCSDHPLHEQVPVFLEQAQKRELIKGPKATFSVPD
ncbi:DUF4013 domain-containing protein [Marinobacter adhaerens]|uniref:DUF4013 domain-containing protein n=1 Tax=Marinobacter adhaerens TaxID=1033846 RepID=A0A851HKQ5_9GAMM|nr:DUF4013 domain-containing protein [Marinobacter adhaerens]